MTQVRPLTSTAPAPAPPGRPATMVWVPGVDLDVDVNFDGDPAGGGAKALKGGSHLCGPGHCDHHRPATRAPQPAGAPAGHVGFRCVARAAPVTPGG